jgi:hypothetical protein
MAGRRPGVRDRRTAPGGSGEDLPGSMFGQGRTRVDPVSASCSTVGVPVGPRSCLAGQSAPGIAFLRQCCTAGRRGSGRSPQHRGLDHDRASGTAVLATGELAGRSWAGSVPCTPHATVDWGPSTLCDVGSRSRYCLPGRPQRPLGRGGRRQPARTEWLYEDPADSGDDQSLRPWRPPWAWGRARGPGGSPTPRFNP